MTDHIFIGGADANATGTPDAAQSLLLKIANRHGLVAGATGTGKTVTLQILAQGFSDAGVPVFCADVKGDLSGIAVPGAATHKLHEKLQERAGKIGMASLDYKAAPVIFWDLFGENGHPVRTTISEMGPLLLSRLLGLTDAQEGVLNIAFEYADNNDLLLLDLKDLRKLLAFLCEDDVREEISKEYGNVAAATLNAIQRNLLVLEREGADHFFGEPALDLADMMQVTKDGKGYVSVLDATKLINSPKLYSTFLLWMLAELFETLPEIGDPDKPKLVFFFDEAHLLFSDAPPALQQKIEQVVRLIRSKGVGVYFVTQNPRDLPETVLAQLGSRMQHALRAYTPSERKGVKAAADSFRPNPAFETEDVITELAVGEALVSTLDAKGTPSIVQRTLIRPPSSRLGPALPNERAGLMASGVCAGKYDTVKDRESAYEILEKKEAAAAKDAERIAKQDAKAREALDKQKARRTASGGGRKRMTPIERAGNQAARTATSEVVRYVLRGIFGSRKR